MSSTMGPRDDGTAIAIGFVPSTALTPPGGATSRELAAGVDRDEAGIGNHLDIVGATPRSSRHRSPKSTQSHAPRPS